MPWARNFQSSISSIFFSIITFFFALIYRSISTSSHTRSSKIYRRILTIFPLFYFSVSIIWIIWIKICTSYCTGFHTYHSFLINHIPLITLFFHSHISDLLLHNLSYISHLFHYSLHYHIPLVTLSFHYHTSLGTLTYLVDNLYMSLTHYIHHFHMLVYMLLNLPHNSYNSLTYLSFHLHT